MKLILLEDAGKAIQNIDARLKAGKPVSEKDFAELTADDIAPYLDPDSRAPKPTGTNETVIIEQYLRKLVGADFDNLLPSYSLLEQSIKDKGTDENQNLFLKYIKELVYMNVRPDKAFTGLVLSFIKDGKISAQDLNSWLLEDSLYERDVKDTQYKIQTYLFLTKQNGAKQYNLRVKDQNGNYRYLRTQDLYDGSKFKPASELRELLRQSQLTGQEEADESTAKQGDEKRQSKEQERLIRSVVSQFVKTNPTIDITKVEKAANTLVEDGDTENTLYDKVEEYFKNQPQQTPEAEEKQRNKEQEKIIHKVVATFLQKNPNIESYKIERAANSLFIDGDTDRKLYNKLNSYFLHGGGDSVTDVVRIPDRFVANPMTRVKAALSAAGYSSSVIDEVTKYSPVTSQDSFEDMMKHAIPYASFRQQQEDHRNNRRR